MKDSSDSYSAGVIHAADRSCMPRSALLNLWLGRCDESSDSLQCVATLCMVNGPGGGLVSVLMDSWTHMLMYSRLE